MGRHNRSAIATLLDRQTRFVILLPVDVNGKGASVHSALTVVTLRLPSAPSTVADLGPGVGDGPARRGHAATGKAIYFCEAQSPWQRGSNENANGGLRDYLPKGSNLTLHTPEHLAAVAVELNARPRKLLDCDTPADRFDQPLAATISA